MVQQNIPTIIERISVATPESRIGVIVEGDPVIMTHCGFFDTVLGRLYEKHPGFVGAFSKEDDPEEVVDLIHQKIAYANARSVMFRRDVVNFYRNNHILKRLKLGSR